MEQKTIMVDIHRNKQNGDAVYGIMTLPFESRTIAYRTLENANFLIPQGIYPLELTWSPKFKKLMPLIQDVPEREGIRIHMGSLPEHSQGCILTSYEGLENLKIFINYVNKLKNQYEENVTLYVRIHGLGHHDTRAL